MFRLSVRVFDNGAPPLYSDTQVIVKVIEESAFPPKVAPLELQVNSYNDDFPVSVIGRVHASDPDRYDVLQYSIVSANKDFFDIDRDDGTLKTKQSLDSGEYALNVSVTDGRYVVYSGVKLTVSDVTDEMASQAVVMRIRNMPLDQFILRHRHDFIQAVHTKLSVRAKDIVVLSIQPASNTVVTPAGRNKRSAYSDLDILFAVRKTRSSFYKGNVLRKRLSEVQGVLQNTLGIKISRIFNDVCAKDSCSENGKCVTKVTFVKGQVIPVITEGASYVSLRHSLLPQCQCKKTYGGKLSHLK